ncbi:hypothetical protein [Arthrobacter gyeryongensis]
MASRAGVFGGVRVLVLGAWGKLRGLVDEVRFGGSASVTAIRS